MDIKVQNMELENKSLMDSLKKQLDSYKKNNKSIIEQIADLDKKLDAKNDEVSKLTKEKLKLEHQVNQLKM